MTIDKEELLRETLIPYLAKNKRKLKKEELFAIANEYMRSVYLRDGYIHTAATVEMLDMLEKRGIV